MTELQLKMIDLHLFIQHIPVNNPILHEKQLYYSLFDKQTIYLLLSYTFYSILYEYRTATENDKYLKRHLINSKKERRNKIREPENPIYVDFDETYQEGYSEDLEEVQIDIGNQMALKESIAQVIISYLNIAGKNKAYSNDSYVMIAKKVKKSREREKKMITDRFKTISIEDRKVENMLKTYKIGKWNVGQQKGLIVYDKETSDRERIEMLARQENEIEFDLINRELDKPENIEPESEVENQFQIDYIEETDISKMHKDYNDGVFYEEDADEDFVDDD
jgi:hypothetical protein